MALQKPDPTPSGLVFSTGYLAPPQPPPWIEPVPEPPITVPVPWPLLVIGAAVAVETLQKRLRQKRIPKTDKKHANKKVLKLSDAYDCIDKVANSAIELAEIGIRYAAAAYHAAQPHFPPWVDWAHSAADFREEVMNHLVVSMKDCMADKVLQQKNERKYGRWTPTAPFMPPQAFPEPLRIRLGGKAHPGVA